MKLFTGSTNFNFIKLRKVMMIFSLILIIISLSSLFTRFLNLGLDFTGGTLIEVEYQDTADLNKVRQALDTAGLTGAVVQ